MIRLHTALSILYSGMLCIIGTIAVAEPTTDPPFQFKKAVQVSDTVHSELVSIELDNDIFNATTDSLSDLRLFNSQGELVAFVVRTVNSSRSQTLRRPVAVLPQSARLLAGGELEITLKLPSDTPPVTQLQIHSPLSNFEHRVRVYRSTDGHNWESVVEDATIFDYSRFLDVRSDTINLPNTLATEIRIVIDNATVEQESRLLELSRHFQAGEPTHTTEQVQIERRPFRVDRVDVWSEVAEQYFDVAEAKPVDIADFDVQHDAEQQQTIINFSTQLQPLSHLTIETASRNFHRQFRLIASRDESLAKPIAIASGALTQLDFKTLQRNDLAVKFAATRNRRYRLVIENGDNPPVNITGIRAEGIAKELIFFAAPDAHLTLMYGNPDVPAASLDTLAINAVLSQGFKPTRVNLGPAVLLVQPVPEPPVTWPALFNDRRVWIAVIGVLSAVLGWFLFQAAKRVDGMDEPPTNIV